MKKLLVLVFALVLLVTVASVSLAVATTLTDGKVEVTFSNGTFGKTLEGNLNFDLTKTYSEQLSAGATIKVKPAENLTIIFTDLSTKDVELASTVAFDGGGWVKFNYSPLVVTVKTSIDGNAANALGVLAGSAGGPGVQVDYTVIEGATVTVMGNTNAGFNYLAKGVYSANGLTIGAGYQAGEATNDVAAAWASYKLGPVTVGGEYASRIDADTTGIRGTVAATFGALTVNGKFQNQAGAFTNFDGDPDAYTSFDIFQDNGTEGSAVAVDATYKATDVLSANIAYQVVLDGGDASYKVGATYALSSSLSADASYKGIGYDNKTAVNLTLTNTFAAGLVGSLSLDMDLAAETNSYTAKVTASI